MKATGKATIKFTNSRAAEEFAKEYTRATLMGHVVYDNTAVLYNVGENEKAFIEHYATRKLI